PLRVTDMNKIIALLSVLILCSGCAAGPNYKRPAVSVPGTYRGLTPEEAAKTQSASIGDQKWWDIFQDEQLRSLIRTALQQNYDVRIAVRMSERRDRKSTRLNSSHGSISYAVFCLKKKKKQKKIRN